MTNNENKVNSDSSGSRYSKIKRIQEIISDKTLSFGCKIFTKERGEIVYHTITDITKQENGEYTCECGGYKVYDIRENNIIGHPVMINRIEYVLNDNDYMKVRKSIKKNELMLPIDDWNDYSIDVLYSICYKDGIQ